MRAVFLIIGQTREGWSVCTTNGAVLATFKGFAARWRAERYLAQIAH